MTAQPISPSATSAGTIGVASTVSYNRSCFSLWKTFIVVS